MRYVHGLDLHIANLYDLIYFQRADLFAVMYDVPKTAARLPACIDVPLGILSGENFQSFHMIAVLMRDENA